jgi:hypothetical protein
MKSRLLSLVLILSPAAGHARLHETPDQCAKRYGTLTKSEQAPGWSTACYAKDAVSTTCFFRAGKCVAISFALIIPDRIATTPAKFTSEQFDALLIANTGSKILIGIEGEDFPVLQSEDRKVKIYAGDTLLQLQLFSDIELRKSLAAEAAVSKAIEGF